MLDCFQSHGWFCAVVVVEESGSFDDARTQAHKLQRLLVNLTGALHPKKRKKKSLQELNLSGFIQRSNENYLFSNKFVHHS
jgi:hypothetical protein